MQARSGCLAAGGARGARARVAKVQRARGRRRRREVGDERPAERKRGEGASGEFRLPTLPSVDPSDTTSSFGSLPFDTPSFSKSLPYYPPSFFKKPPQPHAPSVAANVGQDRRQVGHGALLGTVGTRQASGHFFVRRPVRRRKVEVEVHRLAQLRRRAGVVCGEMQAARP